MKKFLENESGAVTVDWVVLTAGVVGLGLATLAAVSVGVEQTSNSLDTTLTEMEVSASF